MVHHMGRGGGGGYWDFETDRQSDKQKEGRWMVASIDTHMNRLTQYFPNPGCMVFCACR